MKDSNQNSSSKEDQNSKDPSRQLFSSSFSQQNTHQIPEIQLPKGGGALKGIDEKFQVNPVNGTNSVSIPLPVSSARAGFSPSLAMQYSSGQGNGLFGLGWGLGLPSIRRKTDKQLPQYKDSIESDTFVLAGAEDLIPKLEKDSGNWEKVERTTATHLIKQYRPRIEGSWLRIEQWTELGTGILHWRTISTGNVVTVYGDTSASRIENPSLAAESAIFEWLISYTYDNKGNVIRYEYKEEDFENVRTNIYEKNRFFTTTNGSSSNVVIRRSNTVTNRYLKRVHYGNKTHYMHGDALPASSDFLFETLLDYGEHDELVPSPVEVNDWVARPDAFSSFRSGFDIRNYRLCQRVLLFHKFNAPSDQPIKNLLVSALELKYESFPEENVSNPDLEGFTYLKEALSKGYEYSITDANYNTKEMPPMSFYYQGHEWNTEIQTLEEDSLEHSPTGINNNAYNWTDFYGEGISGILTEQNQAWYYKENLGNGAFSPAQLLQEKPSFNGLNTGAVQFQDLEGTGERQLVSWNTPQGFFNFKEGEQWENFQYFEKTLNRNISNEPNARFIDLDGDGRPDLLITENDLFQWYNSEGKKGFGTANTLFKALNEEEGPRIVFADQEQSIFLADMTGDGMTDIVRIKNQEVCYWANQGYGHFSAKIVMGNAPHFDHPELFNPQYLKLTDIDGSGTTDLVYLQKDNIQIWMNHSGNTWSTAPQIINPFPSIDNQVNIDLVDLLGTGTACIVWSSMGAKDAGTPLRYMDLTNSKKPHLLYQYKNNTGAGVQFEYISSTHFYLEDKKAGKPWASKLPFPVHVVHKTTATDKIRNTVFVSKYSYHHGYYDQVEREFRGFGRVEQLDTDSFDALTATGAVNIDSDHFQVPIKTVSWFHTGASFKHQVLTDAYQAEYYDNPTVEQALNGVALPAGLSDQAYHEAFRACKGLPLRQEVYSLDYDNLQHIHPYSASESSYEVQLIQGHEGQRYASFIVVPVQSMSYAYERNPDDPRISQDLVLATDDLGIPTKMVSIIYPRLITGSVPWMVQVEQAKIHGVYKEISLTEDVDDDDAYRLRAAYEEKMYELLGLEWPRTPIATYYDKNVINNLLQTAIRLNFEDEYDPILGDLQIRLSGHGKAQFLKDDLTGVLPFGYQEALGIPGKSYQLAYTSGLLAQLYETSAGTDLLTAAGLNLPSTSGYVGFVNNNNIDWWIPSGETIYPIGATTDFYLPTGMKDALGNETTIKFDSYKYLPIETKDALGNTLSTEYDYRVLSPKLMTDPNGNRTAVAFDTLGIVVKSAVMGKAGQNEGDTLEHPMAEMSYDFFNWMDNQEPNYIHSKVREEHYSITNANSQAAVWQESYEYSDGGGAVILAKVQTKEGTIGTDTTVVKRWIGNGRTVIDNKGNPIKQYEPYFSNTHEYESEAVFVGVGVSPILYYDAAGRNVRTVLPNDTFVKVEFDAWKTAEYDANDTILESKWYDDIMANGTVAEKRVASLTENHYNTPTISHTDCLGRTIYAESSDDGIQNTKIAAFTQTDLAGRFSQIYDQLATDQLLVNSPNNYTITRNLSSYGRTNLLGQSVYSKTAVKGESWVFTDILGRMLRVWDNPDSTTAADQKVFRTEYDTLHRPLKTFVKRGANAEICVAKTIYGESLAALSTWTSAQVLAANLLGQAYQTFDQSGIMTTEQVDFKGNPLLMHRQLVKNYEGRINWDAGTAPIMEPDVFKTSSTYDALNRPKETILPDKTRLVPTYNEGAYLESLSAQIMGIGNSIDFLKGQDYDAKGQRQYVKYGNNVITKFFYDAKTFRLNNLLTTHTNNDTLQDLQYIYDPMGNIMRVKDGAQSTFYYNNEAISPLKEYEYDALYRLKKATGREHSGGAAPTNQDLVHLVNMPHNNIASAVRNYTQTYDYDKAGNILQVKHVAGNSGNWTRNYNYTLNDASNRLESTKIVGGNLYLYNNYDGHGNMTKMPHLQALHWDYQDQLTEVEMNGGGTAYYNYDGGGQRVRKVVVKSGKRTERLYFGGVERYREYTASSVNNPNGTVKLERWTVQIDDIAQVDTLTVDNSVAVANPIPLIRYQYRDHLGSAAMETNEVGEVISYEEYHPFGTSAYRVARSGTNLSLKRYRFTNKERDDETGLYYFGVRYYAAWLGRWTSSDPGGFVDGLNMYVYVRNNPVMLVDEEGYEGEPPLDDLVDRGEADGAKPENAVVRGGTDNVDGGFVLLGNDKRGGNKEDDCPTGDCDDEKNPIGGNLSIPSDSITGRATYEGAEGSVISFKSGGGEFYWNANDENYQSSRGVTYSESDFVLPSLGESRYERAAAKQYNLWAQAGLNPQYDAYEVQGDPNIDLWHGGTADGTNFGEHMYFEQSRYPEVGTAGSLAPIYGSTMSAYYNLQDGDYARASLNGMFLIADVFTIGTASTVVGGTLKGAGAFLGGTGLIRVSKKAMGIRVIGSKKTMLYSGLLHKVGVRGNLPFRVPTLIGPSTSGIATSIGRNMPLIGASLYGSGVLYDYINNDKKNEAEK